MTKSSIKLEDEIVNKKINGGLTNLEIMQYFRIMGATHKPEYNKEEVEWMLQTARSQNRLEMLKQDKQRMQELEFHQLPLFCDLTGIDEDENDYSCEKWLPGEKKSYIIEVRHEFRPEAEDKGKWSVYYGYCKEHFEFGLKEAKYNARWHARNKKGRNPQTQKIGHIWEVRGIKA